MILKEMKHENKKDYVLKDIFMDMKWLRKIAFNKIHLNTMVSNKQSFFKSSFNLNLVTNSKEMFKNLFNTIDSNIFSNIADDKNVLFTNK